MVGVVLLWAHFFARGDYPDLGADARSVLFYFANWHFSTAPSYVNLGSSPSPFLHAWSLAIEEQFYLVWPLLVLGAFKLGLSRAKLFVLTLLAAAGSATLMVCLYDPNQDPTAMYYNTATRAQALLIGAALAIAVLLWAPAARRLPSETVERPRRGRVRGRGGALGHHDHRRELHLRGRSDTCRPVRGGGHRRSDAGGFLAPRSVPLARADSLRRPHFLWALFVALADLCGPRRVAHRPRRARAVRVAPRRYLRRGHRLVLSD